MDETPEDAAVIADILYSFCVTLISEGACPYAVAEAATNLAIEIEEVEECGTLH